VENAVVLIDAHVHLMSITCMNQATWVIDEPHVRILRVARDAWRCLDAGFTTVRDAGGMLALHVKHAIEEGSALGFRIISSVRVISQTAGHGDMHFIPLVNIRKFKSV
jgi:imidazolonepropionase-like amidohydrolase